MSSAYLNAPIDENVFMAQPEGFEVIDGDGGELVCQLSKSLYGLKQAGRNWNLWFAQWLIEHGFVQSLSDPCLFVKREGGKIAIAVCLFVDDMLLAGRSRQVLHDFRSDWSCPVYRVYQYFIDNYR